MSGKGSAPRPFSVSQDIYGMRHDLVFKAMSQKERRELKARIDELESQDNNKGNKNENTSD